MGLAIDADALALTRRSREAQFKLTRYSITRARRASGLTGHFAWVQWPSITG
jgi:hypothetical protein